MTRLTSRPLILIDAGGSRNPNVGLGQVAMQYARALVTHPDEAFQFRFLIQPGFRAFPAAIPAADITKAKFSPTGLILRLFNRRHSRRRSTQIEHNLRHALHRNLHPPHPKDRAPFILTIHDMHFLHARNAAAVMRQIQEQIARASAVGFISQHARNLAGEHLDFAGKIQRVIHNGVEKPQAGSKPAWFNFTRPFLLSVATVEPHKNHIVLPDMMRRLPELALVVAGNRKRGCAEKIEKKIQRGGLSDRIILPGIVSDSEKAWLLEHCAGFVFPSLREGFGMPIVEALHFGKPTFCLQNSALPEVGGPAAYYWEHCEPEHMADVVRENLDANPDAEQKRREWAAQFSWKRNADEHIKLYREVLAQ